MDITIVIPCIYYHFKYIKNLLCLYQNQTLIPKEIIICVNGCENMHDRNLNNIYKNLNLNFNVRILQLDFIKSAGFTRQYASELVNTKYIVYQDADDIPHKQRVEIINYFFNKSNPDHIIHLYTLVTNDIRKYEICNIPNGSWKKRDKLGGTKHYGNISIKKEIIDEIKWIDSNKGEDLKFIDTLLENNKISLKVGASLIWYRKELSSFIGKNKILN